MLYYIVVAKNLVQIINVFYNTMYVYNAYNITFVNSKYYNADRVMDHRQSSNRTYKLFKRVISKFIFVMFFFVSV